MGQTFLHSKKDKTTYLILGDIANVTHSGLLHTREGGEKGRSGSSLISFPPHMQKVTSLIPRGDIQIFLLWFGQFFLKKFKPSHWKCLRALMQEKNDAEVGIIILIIMSFIFHTNYTLLTKS